MKLLIGIPTLNRADLLNEALSDLAERLPDDKEWYLTIVDNGNGQHITVPESMGEKVSIRVSKTNLGVASSWNLILEEAFVFGDFSHVLMLNDDIVFPLDWSVLEHYREEGFVIPPWKYHRCAFLIGRERYAEVGCFDQSFYPAYFEDNDYLYRMRLKELPVTVAEEFTPRTYRNSATIEMDPAVNSGFALLEMYYIRKWGGPPGAEQYDKPFDGREY
tara:strand:+ start:685 stop:1338 length:654 start_codon:yes stop_codon:yes gene_type:complete